MPKKSQVQLKVLALRKRLWPDVKPSHLWNRNVDDGFTTVPRTLPIITTIIDDLTKNTPAGATYFELWCRAYDEMYVNLGEAAALATHSGYTGQRHIRTWKVRLELLAELGFIRTAPGTSGKLSHAVILNPHLVIKGLHEKKTPGLSEEKYAALQERAIAIGSLDFEEEEEEAPPANRRPRGGKSAPSTVAPVATNETAAPTEVEMPGRDAAATAASL